MPEDQPGYKPLVFDAAPIPKKRVRATAVRILNSYFGHLGNHELMTYTRWSSAGWLVLRWLDMKSVRHISLPFRFESICEHLNENRRFVPEKLNFAPLASGWLDASIQASHQVQILDAEHPGEAIKFMYPSAISPKFPVCPLIDREGRAFSSLQLSLLQSVIDLRDRLVTESHELFTGTEWLLQFFSFLNIIVAAVENTLHQLYYRAEFEHEAQGWSFDPGKLGTTHGRRLRDKFAWIGAITGRPLNSCRSEIERFVTLKNIRNHIAHFDPPVFAFTVEDVAVWLNFTYDVAVLLAEVRRLLGEPLCLPLVELLLAREVTAIAANPKQTRIPQGPDVGYASVARIDRTKGRPNFSVQVTSRHR